MKITKQELKRIIKEELEKAVNEVGPHEYGDEPLVEPSSADLKAARELGEKEKAALEALGSINPAAVSKNPKFKTELQSILNRLFGKK